MNIAEYSIQKRTITLVLTFLAFVGGLKSYQQLGRLEDPEFTIKDALVITPYPGASAEDVEVEVTNSIEKACQQLGQLKEIKSISYRGLSIVTATIKDKYDRSSLPQVWDELRRKVGDAQRDLPPGAGPSLVNDDFGDVYGIYFALTGDGYSYKEIKDFADLLKRELLLVPDVKKIAYWGDQKEAIYIQMQREKMANLGITQERIYETLESKNLAIDGGRVPVDKFYVTINPTGEFSSVDQFKTLLVSEPGSDQQVYLGDIATIKRGYVDPPTNLLRTSRKIYSKDGKVLKWNELDGIDPGDSALSVTETVGNPAIAMAISTVDGGNVVTMGEALERRMKELIGQAPIGMEFQIISHQSDSVSKAVNSFVINLLEAVVIVIVVLMVFMGLKSALLIGFILFLTICASFIVMDMQGIMLERISLGALIIALGMLVDNAIVVTDGMRLRIERGEDKLKVAREVVGQNQMPLLGATFVAVLAFGAIGLSQDSTGEYCRSLFSVLLISLLLSWLTAVTVTPLLCTMFFKPSSQSESGEESDPYGGGLYRGYKSLLETAIRFRWITVAIVLALFFSALFGFGFLKNSFFPPSTRPQFMVDVWLPEGTHIRETEKALEGLEKHLLSYQNTKSVATHVGGGAARFLLTYAPEKTNSAYAQMLVDVFDYKQIDSMQKQIQDWMDNHMPDALAYTNKFRLGPGDGGKIQARFSGPDPTTLRNLVYEAMDIVEKDGGSQALRQNWRERVPVVRPVLAETQAARHGIQRTDVASALQAAFQGKTVGVFREGNTRSEDRIIPIVSRPSEEERLDVDNINDVQIYSPAADRMIPIRQVITHFETVYENQIVWRFNRRPTITIHCDPRTGEASELHGRIKEPFERLIPEKQAAGTLPDGYMMEWGGEYESSQKAQAGLSRSLPTFLMLMVLIVIMLFNNLRQPLIIWLTVPLALIGVAAGLLLFDQPFGFMALLGALSLSGMLIKNAIVLMDQINVNL
ncbi:MAG: efflux RND transporter permease subunit, partial [Candidatus Omnitrophica bacterium]|nr:efflux RND transporter permease subunit [Candidatus Omnitrophota bacterium]MCB9770595.1 efflux RND transporter permease subunit [Candidatus Omnitrophota bacterium]